MIRKELTLDVGLHARPAAVFVKEARRYDSDIRLEKNGGDRVNGKSIMGILTLAAGPGSIIYLEVDGPDEEECFAALEDLLLNGLKDEDR
ncbi:MAG: HPr family phosphocarrier protein [Candidatus Coatesbacteria bacterium]|nr:MAG: HPr family phosphocarrier protein [Candidatus Coatesbacteria bacterium]